MIALNAHGDVVPPGQGWTHDPYGAEEKGGAIYGRGAAVSKSDFATYAFALLALKDDPAGLDGTVELHLTYDEETGGFIGPQWLLEAEAHQARLSRSRPASPMRSSPRITACCIWRSRCAASRRMRRCRKAAPTRWKPRPGCSTAIYAERKRLNRIKSKSPGIGSPKITVGLISGGFDTNVVPDKVVMRLDRRLIPEENGAKVERELIALIEARARKAKGIKVECRRIILADPLKPLPGVKKMVETAAAPRQARTEGRDQGNGRAALYRCAPLQRRGHSDGALWRRSALDPGGERACRERARQAVGPEGGDQDRGSDACGIC